MKSHLNLVFFSVLLAFAALFYVLAKHEPASDAPVQDHAAVETFVERDDAEAAGRFVLEGAAKVILRLHELDAFLAESMKLLASAEEIVASDGRSGAEEGAQAAIIQGKVEKGDTIAAILENADNSATYVNAAAKVFPLRSFRAGQPYTVFRDPETGRIRRFEYEVNDRHRLVVEGDEKPDARLEDIEYATRLELCEGVINDSLFQAVADIGENPQLALRLVDLFGSEINFIRDIQEGDSFSVLLEKRYREGEYRGYGRILAARFRNNGKTWEAWLYRDSQGQLAHYNAKGENLKKTLLMAPLAVTRLTSRFTHARKHPILGKTRPHLGVDYGAPTGTPVKAVGHGVVTKKGWAGGYGNQIILKHEAGLESLYAHLSGYARGLKTGQRVRQGQVIGFVGSTGLSTGPHLDFRLRHNGNFINPTKAINPRGAPVPPHLMASFRRVVEQEKAYLEGRALPEQYALDSIVPANVSLSKASPAKVAKASRNAKTVKAAKTKRQGSVKKPRKKEKRR